MIIQYERPENVKEAHTQWLAALDKAKKVVAELQQTDAGAQENTAANIAKQLDSYREQFAHVARQLEAGGYDSATIANRMSVRAVNEFAGAAKLVDGLDQRLRAEVQNVIDKQDASRCRPVALRAGGGHHGGGGVPLTLLNMVSICRPGGHAQPGTGHRPGRPVAAPAGRRRRRGGRSAALAGGHAGGG